MEWHSQKNENHRTSENKSQKWLLSQVLGYCAKAMFNLTEAVEASKTWVFTIALIPLPAIRNSRASPPPIFCFSENLPIGWLLIYIFILPNCPKLKQR